MTGIISARALPKDIREWDRIFAPINKVLRRVQDDGEETVVSDFAGKLYVQVDGVAAGADYALNLISGSGVTLTAVDDAGRINVTVTRNALVDADFPASIARDTEVSAAIVAHVAELDPHTQYALDADVTAALAALNLASGVYTPTLTNIANLGASTAFQCQYLRVGTVVSVSGKLSVDPTAGAASTQLGISLPIASNFGAEEDCGGAAFASAIAGQGAAIKADAANNRALLQFISGDVTNQPMFFSFQYRIIP